MNDVKRRGSVPVVDGVSRMHAARESSVDETRRVEPRPSEAFDAPTARAPDRRVRFKVELTLPVTPKHAWMLLTDPAAMRGWANASVAQVALGNDGSATGVGAIRRVELRAPGARGSVDEIVVASQPPRLHARARAKQVGGTLSYEVRGRLRLAGLIPFAIRAHGELAVEPVGANATRVVWEVALEKSRLPLATTILASQLRARFVRALAHLQASLPDG